MVIHTRDPRAPRCLRKPADRLVWRKEGRSQPWGCQKEGSQALGQSAWPVLPWELRPLPFLPTQPLSPGLRWSCGTPRDQTHASSQRRVRVGLLQSGVPRGGCRSRTSAGPRWSCPAGSPRPSSPLVPAALHVTDVYVARAAAGRTDPVAQHRNAGVGGCSPRPAGSRQPPPRCAAVAGRLAHVPPVARAIVTCPGGWPCRARPSAQARGSQCASVAVRVTAACLL